MSWLEQKYAGLVSSRLHKFKDKGEGVYNFKCPFCTDLHSKKPPRGYLVSSKNKMFYYCHNCRINLPFRKFLERIDIEVYKDYLRETFAERNQTVPSSVPFTQVKKPIDVIYKPPFMLDSPLKDEKKISSLPHDHPAKVYIASRLIPNVYHSRIFYVDKFKAFVNRCVPGKLEEPIKHEHGRIVIPCIDEQGRLFGFQGRSLKQNDTLRYITIFFDKAHINVYGLDNFNRAKRAYLVEGPIDSMFLTNALAMCSSAIDPALKTVVDQANTVVVYDNEPRNKNIIEAMYEAIDNQWQVCVWPEHVQGKDINDMIRSGKTGDAIQRIIDNNSYSGAQARLKITQWKRI